MDDDIERILADDEEIAPSSGFLISVMKAVELEAAAPVPLRFPWKRAWPGLLATIAALAVALWNGIGSLRDPATLAVLDDRLRQLMVFAADLGLQWVILALAVPIISVLLPLSMTRNGLTH
jgi:hypothetical protein